MIIPIDKRTFTNQIPISAGREGSSNIPFESDGLNDILFFNFGETQGHLELVVQVPADPFGFEVQKYRNNSFQILHGLSTFDDRCQILELATLTKVHVGRFIVDPDSRSKPLVSGMETLELEVVDSLGG